ALAAGGVEHQPVERELLHLLDVLPHELRVRLVPAPLDQLLALERVLRRAGLGRRRAACRDGQRREPKEDRGPTAHGMAPFFGGFFFPGSPCCTLTVRVVTTFPSLSSALSSTV